MSNTNKSKPKKIKVFGSGSSVVSVQDNSRVPLILIEGPSGNIGETQLNAYIMNFDSSNRCDLQILKSLNERFLFTTFGHTLTQINITGFQATGIKATDILSDDSSIKITRKNTAKLDDIEEYYRQYCVSGVHPTVFKITTGSSEILKKPSVYKGYMVAFARKPMGEEKVQGYGFTISFICERQS